MVVLVIVLSKEREIKLSEQIKYTDQEKIQLNLRGATVRYVSSCDYRFFITLTFRKKVSEDIADICIGKFIKTLNKRVFGNRSRKALKMVVCLEENSWDGYHYHIACQDPESVSGKISGDAFISAARSIWEKLPGPTGKVSQSCPDGHSWFKEIYNPEGIALYMTKQIHHRPSVVQWHKSNP